MGNGRESKITERMERGEKGTEGKGGKQRRITVREG